MGGLLAFVRSVTATHCFVQANGRTLWMLSQWCCVLSSSSSCGSVEERDGGLSLSLSVCVNMCGRSGPCCVVSCPVCFVSASPPLPIVHVVRVAVAAGASVCTF